MIALRNRDFRLLWTAGLVSTAGDWMLLVAMPILVYQLTGSTLGTALTFLAELVPPIVIGPFAGRLADRWDRRRLMVWISGLHAVFLLPLLFVRDAGDLWIIYLVVATQAVLSSFFQPSKDSLLPSLVPPDDLLSANSLLGVNMNAARLVGGPLGGLLLALGNLQLIVVVDVLSFVLAAFLVARLRPVTPVSRTTAEVSAGGDDRRRVRVGLTVAAVAGLAQGLFLVLFVPFVEQILHGDAAETGLLRGVQAIGAAIAGLLLGFLVRRVRPGVLVSAGAAVFGVITFVVWNAPAVTTADWLYVSLFIAVGAPGVVMGTGIVTVLQKSAPASRRGRVFGAFTTIFAAGQAAGMLLAGFGGDAVGLLPLLNFQAVAYVVAAAVALLLLRRAREDQTDRVPELDARGPLQIAADGRRVLVRNAEAGA